MGLWFEPCRLGWLRCVAGGWWRVGWPGFARCVRGWVSGRGWSVSGGRVGGVWGFGAAADVCGVGGPVAGGVALPADGDVGVDAQGAGQDRGGGFGGELEKRWAAVRAGAGPAGVEPLGWSLAAD